MTQQDRTGHFWALLPLFVFVILYFCGSLYLGDFYALPVLVVLNRSMTMQDRTGYCWALLQLFVFVILYFCGSLYLGAFYALPVLVVFVIALFVAFFQYPKKSFEEKLKSFAKGSGDENILVMILIFLLAGAFSELRSEEHTSELQSRENLVCRLLLEKKKNKN